MQVLKFIIFSILIFTGVSSVSAQRSNDWIAIKDHTIVIENGGWTFPVEIAFVPNPGSNPKDPLYYVSELRGTIKVVTNDRTVLTYAENVNTYRPPTELPNELAELGLAGICLDPANGYLFATTLYARNSALYNKIVRFEHETRKFGTKPKKHIELTRIFDNDESGTSHQIGKCVIGKDGKLYVGVGDGHAAHKAQGLDNPNGKLLRMNLDGTAPKDNPYYSAQDPEGVAGYIFAYGLRNPFGIALDDQDILYITDNGPNRDRLIETIPGKNYLWDGTNESMRGDSIWNWSGSVGPAGAAYLGEKTKFPYWRGRVLVSQGGSIQAPGPSEKGRVTINSFPVKAGRGLTGKPEILVSYRGNYMQLLVPVAEGPDGIYFSGFFPDPEGETYIYKLIRQEGKVPDMKSLSGSQLFQSKGCAGCHKINGIGGQAGPALDGLIDRLQQRLNSAEYEKQLDEIDQLDTPVHVKYRKAREEIRSLTGEEKIKFWLQHRITEPRFDVQLSQMAALPTSPEELEQLTAYLMTLRNHQERELSEFEEIHRRFRVWWDTDYNAKPTVGFIVGVLITLLFQFLIRKLWRLLRSI
ncbi:MAG: PQQ-dependent sugar dehydrogenase [SAR324 cluster bacterium]|nr:PQQ-dependent sugar dehydrogenase [SAR324 cluster bacterium]